LIEIGGLRSLALVRPDLVRRWHPTKNLPLTPATVSYGSKKKVFWTCDNDHEYVSSVNLKTSKNTDCPVCSNRLILAGVNDFQTLRPDLIERWAWDLNGALSPVGLSLHSRQKAWWTCPSDARHRWQAQIQLVTRGAVCAVCHGAQVQSGVNDLASLFPKIAEEWHSSKNNGLLPNQITASSHKRVWWQCPVNESHEYQASVSNRSGRNSGCPVCDGKLVLPGINDFGTANPELLVEWDSDLNKDFVPSQFSLGSHKLAFWKCSKNHSWKASIKDRIRGRGCPFCANKSIAEGENDLATTNPELLIEWDLVANHPLSPLSIGAGSSRKVSWVCRNDPRHKWRASPSGRTSTRASGCPSCAKYGFSPSRPGVLYFIENRELRARKIGVTNTDAKTDRVGAFIDNGWHLLISIPQDDGQVVLDAEFALFRWLRHELSIPVFLGKVDMANMSGSTETFSSDAGPTNQEVIQKIHEVLGHPNR